MLLVSMSIFLTSLVTQSPFKVPFLHLLLAAFSKMGLAHIWSWVRTFWMDSLDFYILPSQVYLYQNSWLHQIRRLINPNLDCVLSCMRAVKHSLLCARRVKAGPSGLQYPGMLSSLHRDGFQVSSGLKWLSHSYTQQEENLRWHWREGLLALYCLRTMTVITLT